MALAMYGYVLAQKWENIIDSSGMEIVHWNRNDFCLRFRPTDLDDFDFQLGETIKKRWMLLKACFR